MSVVGLQSPNRLPLMLLRNSVRIVPGSSMFCSIELVQAGEHDGAALADRVEAARDDLRGHEARA